jgi:tellurite methyltransferase
MTIKDREKWDSRYLKGMGGSEPSSILTKFWSLASVGNALDIACGNGRNSIFLAEKGFVVDAVDISAVATNHLAGKNPNINVICTDLDTWKIPQNRYELIVNIRFSDRRLFPMIQDGLRPGGVLIFESFMDGEKDEYCLKQNELLRAFRSFRIVYYEEKKSDHSEKFDQTASLVAIKTASSGEQFFAA